MAPDIDTLSQPLSLDAPAGPDLSYDNGRQAIEQAFADDGEEVDWPRTIALTVAQAQETRDVWLAIYWMRAGAQSGDLEAVESGATLLADLFERMWTDAHPTIAEYGIQGRRGACESLVRIGEFLGPLRRVPLIQHARLGSFSGADLERFAEGGTSEPGYGPFRAAVADTPVDVLEAAVARLTRIEAAIRRADAVLSDRASAIGETGTNFEPTYDVLRTITRALAPFTGATHDDELITNIGEVSPQASQSNSAGFVAGRINNREDVAKSIDQIIAYYARSEPSSPIPIGLKRIKSWITMDFMEILKDIAPGSGNEASAVLMARDSGGSSSDLM